MKEAMSKRTNVEFAPLTTHAMRDRLQELSTPYRDDYDKVVCLLLQDFAAFKEWAGTPFVSTLTDEERLEKLKLINRATYT